MTNSIYIDWSTFINKIIDFILIALVLFIIIKVFMGLQNARKNIDEKAKARAEKLAKKYRKQGLSEEEAKAKAEAEAATEAQAPAEPAKPTTDELLTEIRDLLAAQNKNENK
jgi:large-conductance mechanosensitive channel